MVKENEMNKIEKILKLKEQLYEALEPILKDYSERHIKEACKKNLPEPKNLVDKFPDLTIGELTVIEYYRKLVIQAIDGTRVEW